MRMQVAARLRVDKTDNVTVSDKTGVRFHVQIGVSTVRVEEPLVVGILVVIASDLLLSRTFRVRLNVTVEQAATVTHVLDGDTRPQGNLQWTVSSDFGAPQVGLEK